MSTQLFQCLLVRTGAAQYRASLHWGEGVWLNSHPGLVHSPAQIWDQHCWCHLSDNPVSMITVHKALFLPSVNYLSVRWDLKHKQCFSGNQKKIFLGLSCAGTWAGLDPCGSVPTQDIQWFYDFNHRWKNFSVYAFEDLSSCQLLS